MSTEHHGIPFTGGRGEPGEPDRGARYVIRWRSDPRYVLCGHATEGFVDVRDRATVSARHCGWHIDADTGIVTLAADAEEYIPRVLTLLLGPSGHGPALRRLATPADRDQRWTWTGRALLSHKHSTADKLAVHVGHRAGEGAYGLKMVLPGSGGPEHEWELVRASG
ncbi:hypothetical protein [Streptomyces abikoensis]|uniref:hypothetical protein n=1 Tax=Streptomyces abikoensis TaxID=97398 RepID=UPI0033F5F1E4